MSAVEGRRYFNALLSLDRRPEVVELRTAGVAQETICALYPVEFKDLAPGLTKLLGAGSLAHMRAIRAVDLPWAKFASPWGQLLVASSNRTRVRMTHENNEFNMSPEGWALLKHIVSVMPLENAQLPAGKMTDQLFQLHWHMTNVQSPEHEQRANAALAFAFEIIFPNFIERTARLN